MKHCKILSLSLALIAFFACTNNTGVTTYTTNYTIKLSEIPSPVPLDSARVVITVNGVQDSSFLATADQLSNRQISFSVVSTGSESVTVSYKVFSGKSIVANGVDSLVPSKAGSGADSLARDTNMIRQILQNLSSSSVSSSSIKGVSSSSMNGLSSGISSGTSETAVSSITFLSSATSSTTNSSSSAGITAADFSIGFTNSTSTVHEGVAPSVYLRISGPANATLPTNQTIVLVANPGTATASDYSLSPNVLIRAGTKAGDSILINTLSIPLDQLVEGPETFQLMISDPAGFGTSVLAQTQAITIQDADSAWVDFTSTTPDSIAENSATPKTISYTLHTKPAGGALAVPVALTITPTATSTAVSGTNYTYTSTAVSFPKTTADLASQTISIQPKNDGIWSNDLSVSLRLTLSSGPATVAATTHTLWITNSQYEYYVVDGATTYSIYTPDFVFVKSFTKYYSSWKGSYVNLVGTIDSTYLADGFYAIVSNYCDPTQSTVGYATSGLPAALTAISSNANAQGNWVWALTYDGISGPDSFVPHVYSLSTPPGSVTALNTSYLYAGLYSFITGVPGRPTAAFMEGDAGFASLEYASGATPDITYTNWVATPRSGGIAASADSVYYLDGATLYSHALYSGSNTAVNAYLGGSTSATNLATKNAVPAAFRGAGLYYTTRKTLVTIDTLGTIYEFTTNGVPINRSSASLTSNYNYITINHPKVLFTIIHTANKL